MAYGTIKVDTITFTDGAGDKSVTISGLVQNPTFTGNVTVTGTVSGTTATFTTGTFTSLTGTTSQGTTATYTSGSFTSLTGVTTSGTTANFVSGVFTTQISGATITGTAGAFATLTGGVATLTSGVFALGTQALPSITFTGDTDTGIYSPGANQVAITTSGTSRLFVNASGQVGIGTTSPGVNIDVRPGSGNGGSLRIRNSPQSDGSPNDIIVGVDSTAIYGTAYIDTAKAGVAAVTPLVFKIDGSERARITSDGTVNIKGAGSAGVTQAVSFDGSAPVDSLVLTSGGNVGVGNNAPNTRLHVADGEFTISTGGNASDNGGIINFGITPFATFSPMATIQGLLSNAAGTELQGGLGFFTRPAGTAGQTLQRRMTISSQGNVGIGTTSPTSLLHVAGSATAANWSFNTTQTAANTGTGIFAPAGDTIGFAGGGAERARIDSSGRLLVGTSNYSGAGVGFELEGTGSFGPQIRATAKGSDIFPVYQVMRKSRGASIVQNGDFLYDLQIQGFDGTSYIYAASIRADVDGTPAYAATALVNGQTYRIVTVGTTDFTLIGASANTVGTVFTATGPGTGTGTAILNAGNMPGRLVFSTTADGASSLTERMRITQGGYLKASNNGNYSNATGAYHELYQTANAATLWARSTNVSLADTIHYVTAARSNNSAYHFLVATSGYGGVADDEFRLRGDGNAFADGSWTGGGADYAEFFEWSDSNPNAEDRRGISVVLDGDKIREAVAGEDPIGVISGNPSVVGDAAWNKWSGKYLRDEFGTYIQEDYEVTDDDGNTVIQQRRKLNPAYDPEVEYVSRENRPEWDCVGLMGKLRIRKGQITGSRWIKMRDISATVEEWLVR